MIFLVIIAYAFIAFFHIPRLIKKEHWRDLVAFSLFFLIAFILSILYTLGIKIPSPMKGINHVLDLLHLHY